MILSNLSVNDDHIIDTPPGIFTPPGDSYGSLNDTASTTKVFPPNYEHYQLNGTLPAILFWTFSIISIGCLALALDTGSGINISVVFAHAAWLSMAVLHIISFVMFLCGCEEGNRNISWWLFLLLLTTSKLRWLRVFILVEIFVFFTCPVVYYVFGLVYLPGTDGILPVVVIPLIFAGSLSMVHLHMFDQLVIQQHGGIDFTRKLMPPIVDVVRSLCQFFFVTGVPIATITMLCLGTVVDLSYAWNGIISAVSIISIIPISLLLYDCYMHCRNRKSFICYCVYASCWVWLLINTLVSQISGLWEEEPTQPPSYLNIFLPIILTMIVHIYHIYF